MRGRHNWGGVWLDLGDFWLVCFGFCSGFFFYSSSISQFTLLCDSTSMCAGMGKERELLLQLF